MPTWTENDKYVKEREAFVRDTLQLGKKQCVRKWGRICTWDKKEEECVIDKSELWYLNQGVDVEDSKQINIQESNSGYRMAGSILVLTFGMMSYQLFQ